MFRLKNGKIEPFIVDEKIDYFASYDALEVNDGELWVAGRAGVYVIKDEKVKKIVIKNIGVAKIYKDKEGIIWAGTFNGLARLDGDRIVWINKSNGLASNTVFGIKEDGLGYLWVSGKNGIQRLSLDSLKQVADNKMKKVEGVRFGISEGMSSDKCPRFSKNGILEPEKGKLWFSTNKGIVEFDSLKLKINKIPPGVLIRKVLINSKKVAYSKKEVVYRGIKNIAFSLTVSTFISPENVRIKYRLIGHDKNWHELNRHKQRLVSYYDLPEGKYSFQVIAANSHGVWNTKGDRRDFIIKKDLFQSKGFKYFLLFFVLGLIIVSAFSIKKFLYYKKINNKYKKSNLDIEETKVVLEKINHLLIKEKVFLEDNISMKNLAEKIGIPSHKLSQIINEKMSKSFWDLINSYRIMEAKELLCHKDSKNLTILEIAYKVGFNSNVSFNRAFKKLTKITPTQYRKKNNQSESEQD